MRNTSLRVVLSTRGTLGDIAPFLGLAKQLKALGHRPVLAACRSHEKLAREHGIDFAPVAPHMGEVCAEFGLTLTEVTRRGMNPWRGGQFTMEHFLLPYGEQTFGDLKAVIQGADVLVAHPTMAPWAGLVALHCGVPWRTLVLQCLPLLISSAQEPPVLPGMSLRWLAKTLGPKLYRLLLKGGRASSRRAYRFIDDQARQWGLYEADVHPVFDRTFSSEGVMAMFPSQLLGELLPTDLGLSPIDFLGFGWFDPSPQPMPEALTRFLDDGPPPVVLTLGSSVLCVAGGVYKSWSRQCERLGLRAVFIGDVASLGRDAPKSQMVLPWVSLPGLLARSQAVVNPGGMGLCSQVMAAGLAQLIVPFAFDQPDNALRMARFGGALVLPPAKARGQAMEDALSRLVGDEALKARSRAVQAQLDPVCGTQRAAQLIDRQFGARDRLTVA
jgi:rhamnosyltransferase subunit B